MAKILEIVLRMEVADQEHASFLERLAGRSTVVSVNDSTAIPAGAGTPAAPENDEAEDDDQPAAPPIAVPWLENVHASTKGKNADGTWKRKKGVTKEAMEAAENAWRAAQVAAPTFTVPGSIAGGAPVTLPNPDQPAVMPGMPGAGAMPGGMPAAPPAPVSYQDMVNVYQEIAGLGKIDATSINALYLRAGVQDVNALVTDETLRRAVVAELNKLRG